MTVYYLDTSAIMKRYRTEQGTDLANELFEDSLVEDQFYFSFLSILEMTSSIVRLVKGNRLHETLGTEILARFRQDVLDIYRVWPMDEHITRSAVSVVENHKLRSGDAIHLASALEVQSIASDLTVVMVSTDLELLEASTTAGIVTLNPQDANASRILSRLRAT
jgi:hypothetical protein